MVEGLEEVNVEEEEEEKEGEGRKRRKRGIEGGKETYYGEGFISSYLSSPLPSSLTYPTSPFPLPLSRLLTASPGAARTRTSLQCRDGG